MRTREVVAGLQASAAEEIERLRSELEEARQQQAATAGILKVIRGGKFELRPVLNTIVESANRLCAAEGTNIWPREGAYYSAASYGIPAEFTDRLDQMTL